MEELEQFRERYLGLTSVEVRDLIRDDSVFRREIETLYVAIFHASLNKTCSDCWLDAYIILCRTQTEKLMELKSRKFELRPGALLIDVVGHDNAKMASGHNLTDELALYHLGTNPGCIRKFSKFPENWQQLAALQQATKAAQTAVKSAETRLAKVRKDGDEKQIAQAEKRLAKAIDLLNGIEEGVK